MALPLLDLADSIKPTSSDVQLLELASRFRDEADDVAAVAVLARRLAESGRIEKVSSHSADIASTGGPSSLTTLLCPLFLVLAGWDVPKLTVPGRPAGGIDVLMTIPGYRGRASVVELRTWLRVCGYAHILATAEWAPLDARLFDLRKRHGFQSVRPLVVASILSKKFALQLSRAAIEIRRGAFGNLGDDESEIERAVELFSAVGKLLDIPCIAIVSGAGRPYQPYIGRGEALVALHKLFINECSPSLYDHIRLCKDLAERAGCTEIGSINGEQLRLIFEANLIAQGASYETFEKRVTAMHKCRYAAIIAPSNGLLRWDLGMLRSAIEAFQGSTVDGTPPDECGVVLERLGDNVARGDMIARVRGDERAVEAVTSAFTISRI